uniref:Ribosomal protein mS38 C-terminal domain-containing protein n=1 Tax=Attheya septentrionalis TaxID=420275 RepID=A0A6T7F1Z6_9STRA|mmetsp:Transcript_12247/g.22227  ORF Transcript_12247/g.22227 Transcript_12247/m.22227 type:complete len:130 (+) Transcript_12247:282-671(+)
MSLALQRGVPKSAVSWMLRSQTNQYYCQQRSSWWITAARSNPLLARWTAVSSEQSCMTLSSPSTSYSGNPFWIEANHHNMSAGTTTTTTTTSVWQEMGLWFSSTLKKRRAKMNKHKLRKRRKKLRLKTK